MIIIEGPDLVGKTTLAKKLVERSEQRFQRLHYKHFSRLPDTFHRYWDYLEHIKPTLVLDRFFMSEPVYAAVRGDVTPMHPNWLIPLQREVLAAGGITIVIAARDTKLITERWRDGEMYHVEQVHEANRLFKEIAEFGKIGEFIFHVDLSYILDDNMPFVPDAEIDHILNFHRLVCNRAAYLKGTREFPIPKTNS